jgi:hypothetical protein
LQEDVEIYIVLRLVEDIAAPSVDELGTLALLQRCCIDLRMLVRAMLLCSPDSGPLLHADYKYTSSSKMELGRFQVNFHQFRGSMYMQSIGPYRLPSRTHNGVFFFTVFRDRLGPARAVTIDTGRLVAIGGQRDYNAAGDSVDWIDSAYVRLNTQILVPMQADCWYGVVPQRRRQRSPQRRVHDTTVLVWKNAEQKWGACTVDKVDRLLQGVLARGTLNIY